MKTIFIIILTSVITNYAFAQTPDKALARVKYTFIHLMDTNQKNQPHIENMLLITGRYASLYTSYDKINQNISINKQLIAQMKAIEGGKESISSSITNEINGKPITQADYFFFALDKKNYTRERIFSNYLIEEDAPTIAWKITKDTTTFSGIKCRKATVNFKGRNWIAWFAPELPFQSGPWKLNGLPGLILDAYDEKKEVQFQFAGIEKSIVQNLKPVDIEIPRFIDEGMIRIMGIDPGNAYFDSEIKLPSDVVKTTKKELERLKLARINDPKAFINAQMATNGIQLKEYQKTLVNTIPANNQKNVVKFNNPIEKK